MSSGLCSEREYLCHAFWFPRPSERTYFLASSKDLQFLLFGGNALPSIPVFAISHCGVGGDIVRLFARLRPFTPLGRGLDAQRAYVRPRLREGAKLHITRALVAGTQEVSPAGPFFFVDQRHRHGDILGLLGRLGVVVLFGPALQAKAAS